MMLRGATLAEAVAIAESLRAAVAVQPLVLDDVRLAVGAAAYRVATALPC